MPFALIAIGIIALVISVRDKGRDARALLLSEFTGDQNFFSWIAGIGAVGALGYIPAFRGLSRAFLVLIFVGIILSNEGFFAKLQTQLLNRSPRQVEPENARPSTEAAPSANGQQSQVTTPNQQLALLPSPNTVQSYPSGVGNNAWWGGGLPPASGTQAPCPPGTRSAGITGWGNAFRCIPE